MNRVAVTVGVGNDWRGDPLAHDVVQDGLGKVRDHLAAKYGGYTEEIVHGGWRKNGHVVEEGGRRFIVVANVIAPEADDLARMIGRAFKQQAVMLEVEPLVEGSGVLPVW